MNIRKIVYYLALLAVLVPYFFVLVLPVDPLIIAVPLLGLVYYLRHLNWHQ